MPSCWIDINSETDAAVRSLESMSGDEHIGLIDDVDGYQGMVFEYADFGADFDILGTDYNTADDAVDVQTCTAGKPQKCSTPDAKRRRLSDDSAQTISHIKRPMNAFMIWSQIERRKMAVTDPGLHNSVISRMLGQRWQKMSTAERQPFVRKADIVRQVHLQEHPDYRYCPKRREKRKHLWRQSQVLPRSTVVVPQENVQQPRVQIRASQETWPKSTCSSHEAAGNSSSEEPIRCFRATLGQSLSSAVKKCSFMSSCSLASSVGSNLSLKLTIDSSFREKLKSRKASQQSSSSGGSTSVAAETSTEPATSARYCLTAPNADDSGWGSNSNSGSSSSSASSECNLSLSEGDLALDDALSAVVVIPLSEDLFEDQTIVQEEGSTSLETADMISCPSDFISNYQFSDDLDQHAGGPQLTNIQNLYNSLTAAGLPFDFDSSQLDIDDNSDFLPF